MNFVPYSSGRGKLNDIIQSQVHKVFPVWLTGLHKALTAIPSNTIWMNWNAG